MIQKEFTIKALPTFKFRVGKILPTQMLALNTFVDFKNFEKTEYIFNFILEHVEVNVAGQWTQVKEQDTYMPVGIEDNFKALEQIEYYFLQEVLMPLFTESKE